MNNKRKRENSGQHTVQNTEMTVVKLWKEKPPGPEQLELERMFKCNEIDARASPDSTRQKREMFKGFSAAVFANHFRKTKAKLGLCATVASADLGTSSIMELGGVPTRDDTLTPPEMFSRHEPLETIAHTNAPCWTWIYTDHEKKRDFVCVALPSLCGKNSNFMISDDGMQISITYEWPKVMFRANKLFEKSTTDNGRKLTMGHPKVHAFVSHLLDSGVTENSTLPAQITIQLPRKIQRENDSWSKEKVILDDTKMILLQFSAYQKSLIINDADTSLDF